MRLMLKTFAILAAVPTIYLGVTRSTILMPPPVKQVKPVISIQYVTKQDMENQTHRGNWWNCTWECPDIYERGTCLTGTRTEEWKCIQDQRQVLHKCFDQCDQQTPL
jgi:hypothetical protein